MRSRVARVAQQQLVQQCSIMKNSRELCPTSGIATFSERPSAVVGLRAAWAGSISAVAPVCRGVFSADEGSPSSTFLVALLAANQGTAVLVKVAMH